jgi:hypothetical protein
LSASIVALPIMRTSMLHTIWPSWGWRESMVSVCYQVQNAHVLDNHFYLDSLASGVYAAVGLAVHPQQ